MIQSKTIRNLTKYYDLLNRNHNTLSLDEKDFIINFQFTLAESLISDFSTDSSRVAKMILAYYDE